VPPTASINGLLVDPVQIVAKPLCPSTTTTGATTEHTTTDQVTAAVSSRSALETAINKFATDVATARTHVDATTGINYAAQVSVVVIGVATPEKTTDGAYKFAVTVSIIPNDATVTVSAEHQRTFCKPLIDLISGISGVTITSDCTWTAKTSVKRQATPSTWDMSATAPGPVVEQAYPSAQTSSNPRASAASTVIVAFGTALISLFVSLFM